MNILSKLNAYFLYYKKQNKIKKEIRSLEKKIVFIKKKSVKFNFYLFGNQYLYSIEKNIKEYSEILRIFNQLNLRETIPNVKTINIKNIQSYSLYEWYSEGNFSYTNNSTLVYFLDLSFEFIKKNISSVKNDTLEINVIRLNPYKNNIIHIINFFYEITKT